MTPTSLMLNWTLLLDALSLGMIVLDAEGRVVHWNAWITRHSGVTLGQAKGQRLEDIFPNALSSPFRHAVRNALRHRLPIVLSNVLHRSPLPLFAREEHRANGQRMPQSVTLQPVHQPDTQPLCLIQVTDISVLAKRERVLQIRSDKLSREAVIDGLTSVFNRKYFDQKLRAELERSQRNQSPVALVMLDVDSFKAYNDTYGHPAGDRVLIAIADTVREEVNRATDVLARYGGEEFAAVLPSSDERGAQVIAERVRRAVEALNIPHAASTVARHVTVSLGVACHDPKMPCTAEELLELADRALYDAKRAGRNQVCWVMSGGLPLDSFPTNTC
jgi:diguanylate cyclase (GGDEF)-like protein/PAS domain S-box-containing protein